MSANKDSELFFGGKIIVLQVLEMLLNEGLLDQTTGSSSPASYFTVLLDNQQQDKEAETFP